MTEYRISDEKDGIKVEMVVTVDGTVSVGFLITNNRGADGNVYVKYYDDLGNSKEFQIPYVRGDVNKSTGVLYSFSKPNNSFKACFDITKVEDIPPYPQPVITEIWIHSPNYVCEYETCYDAGSDYPLWRNGKQEYVPVFPYKSGFAELMGWSRDKCYIYSWPSLKVHVPPFGGGYQWAVVDVKSVAGWCPDQFSYLTVYPSGGDYWVIERRHRKYVEDFCFDNWSKTVSLDIKTVYKGYLENSVSKPSIVYITYEMMQNIVQAWTDGKIDTNTLITFTRYWQSNTPVTDPNLIDILINLGIVPAWVFEAKLNTDSKILTFSVWVVRSTYNPTGTAYVYKNSVKIAELGSGHYRAMLRGDFKAGDIIWVTGFATASNMYQVNYSFNDVPDTMSFRVIYRTWTHKVDIKAYGVPEEFADEFVSWLRSRGVNAVKINPTGTASA